MLRLLAFWTMVLGVCQWAGLAHAWTEAKVRTASANIEIDRDGRARVVMVVSVRVDRGWLREFEVDGLEPELELDPRWRARFIGTAGWEHPEIRNAGNGRVVFSFSRSDAPRRGDYLVMFAYFAPVTASAEGDQVRLGWTMPAWRYGLADVTVRVQAPGTPRPMSVEGLPIEIETEGGALVYRRTHLPRTQAWTISVLVERARMNAGLFERAPTPTGNEILVSSQLAPGAAPLSRSPLSWLVALLAAVALARGIALARTERAERLAPAGLLPVPAGLRLPAMGVVAVVAAWAAPSNLELSVASMAILAVLGIALPAARPAAARLGAFRPASRTLLRRALRRRWLRRLGSPFDATRPLGLLVATAAMFGPSVMHLQTELLGAASYPECFLFGVLAAVPFWTGTERSRPQPPEVALASLVRWAKRCRISLEDSSRGFAMRPVVHVDVRGELQDARLRIAPDRTPKGLLRLDVVMAQRRDASGWSASPALLVVSREGSPVERALGSACFEDLAMEVVETIPRRIARSISLDPQDPRALARAVTQICNALAHCPVDTSAREILTPHRASLDAPRGLESAL